MADEKKGITGALSRHLKGVTRSTVESLAKRFGVLPSDHAWAVIDVGASMAGVSLNVTNEFFKVSPEVAKYLGQDDLRAWAELGRRIATANPEEAVEFLGSSAETLAALPEPIQPLLVALCAKQIVLSPATALSTWREAPRTVAKLGDEKSATRLFAIAVEVAHRSVKHSVEVLAAAPLALTALQRLEAEIAAKKPGGASGKIRTPVDAVLGLAENFAQRTGATAAEFLATVGEGLLFIQTRNEMVALCDQTQTFLERGGATALQYFRSARAVLEHGGPASFEKWSRVTRRVAEEGNALVYDFLKLTPKILAALAHPLQRAAAQHRNTTSSERINVVLQVVEDLTAGNVYSALECFKSAPRALSVSSLEQFQVWAREGAELYRQDRRRAQAYYALESKSSQENLTSGSDGVRLESIAPLLRLYVEGLTGRELQISAHGAIPDESRINDETSIQLPAVVAEFGNPDDDFRLYKALAAHAAGQIEFGTRAVGTGEVQLALREIDDHFNAERYQQLYEQARRRQPNIEELHHYLESAEVMANAPDLPPLLKPEQIAAADYKTVIGRFPNPGLAARIFTTLENGRIDHRLRQTYRGIRRDLNFIRARLIERRPSVLGLPMDQLVYEILFQITLCGGVADQTAREAFYEIIRQFERIVNDYLRRDDASVADTLMATKAVYNLLQQKQEQEKIERESEVAEEEANEENDPSEQREDQQQAQRQQQQYSADPFNQWSEQNDESLQTDSDLLNELMNAETPEQELQEGDLVFQYDEWDRELMDHRARWCRVIQRENRKGQRDFVEKVRVQYAGVISSIRNQFQMLRPESLRRIKGETDGADYDLQAVIDRHIDLKTTGRPSDRVYIRHVRRERDVAVSFLLDMSSSTARTITRHPNQPYTRPGQKIIDIEKQGLVLMSEALEAVGDAYAIYGFTSEGRRNVKYFVIKQFGEKYTIDVERRIGGITYHNNTRLGAAVRHAATMLERQDARTKLLIVLSDGRPYDHDYGDSRYAREDTKMALRYTKASGITPFCITIDRESEAELKDLYGDVGYTIIDDVMSLPERLPGIYRRLTT
ncbi:MAG: nitric oxide reductase activation protein NorD [Blastocatellia bacterium]